MTRDIRRAMLEKRFHHEGDPLGITRQEAIVCRACGVQVERGLIADDDLSRLQSDRNRLNEETTSADPPAALVICPWCGVGDLFITDVDFDDGENAEGSKYYYPIGMAKDGTVGIHVSGYPRDGETLHYTASMDVAPTHADYQLWRWIARNKKRFHRVASYQLESIRGEFQAWKRGWGFWVLHRLKHRRRSGWVQSLREFEG